jgi:hypothetical protein
MEVHGGCAIPNTANPMVITQPTVICLCLAHLKMRTALYSMTTLAIFTQDRTFASHYTRQRQQL